MGLLGSAAAPDLPVVVKYLLHATPVEAAPALVDALRTRCTQPALAILCFTFLSSDITM